jgi:hypothetical protein
MIDRVTGRQVLDQDLRAGVRVTEREERFVAVRALIDGEPPIPNGPGGALGHLHRLCAASARSLPARGVAITLMTAEGGHQVAIASDSHTQLLEEQQFSFGEGPCVDSFAARRPVLSGDLGADAGRWPAYAPAAYEQGIRAVFAFPLQIGASRLGVLDVYRDFPGGLAPSALAEALTYADIALQTLLDGQRLEAVTRPSDGLESAVDSRAELFQAQGMIMIQLGVSLTEAMSRLRGYAFANNRRIGDVARDVVARRLQLEPDGDPDQADR